MAQCPLHTGCTVPCPIEARVVALVKAGAYRVPDPSRHASPAKRSAVGKDPAKLREARKRYARRQKQKGAA